MIDLDNTLNNLQETVVGLFNERYNTSYTLDCFTKYNISECLPKEDAIKMTNMYDETGIYNYVKPLPGSQESIQKLIRSGHDVYIITQSEPNIFNEKVEWIKYWFPYIDKSHIICMEHKWLFRCDIMIEDNLNNLLGGHHYDRICFDYMWNRDIHDEAYIIDRVHNWNEAIDVINKLDRKWSDVAV